MRRYHSDIPSLEACRSKIDEIDRQLLKLVVQRLRLALRAGELKKSSQTPVRDLEREEEVIQSYLRGMEDPLTSGDVKRLTSVLLEISRNVQSKRS